MPSSHIPRRHSTSGFVHLLIIVIFPLMISAFQLLGKISIVATWASSILVVCKVILEMRHHRAACRRQSHLASPQPLLVPLQAPAPTGRCFLCHQVRPLHPFQIAALRAGICHRCQNWITFSRQYA